MKNSKGLFNGCGAYMGIGDVFEIPGDGIIIEHNFTVCFWFLFPLPEKKENSYIIYYNYYFLHKHHRNFSYSHSR